MLLIDSIHSFSLLLKPCSRIGRPTTSCCFLSADHDNDDRSNDNCKDENEPRQQPSDSIILNNNDIIGNEASQAAANILSSMQEDENKNGDDKSACTTTTLRINDHGSDLTNRFKYKVNALMGNFVSWNYNHNCDDSIIVFFRIVMNP